MANTDYKDSDQRIAEDLNQATHGSTIPAGDFFGRPRIGRGMHLDDNAIKLIGGVDIPEIDAGDHQTFIRIFELCLEIDREVITEMLTTGNTADITDRFDKLEEEYNKLFETVSSVILYLQPLPRNSKTADILHGQLVVIDFINEIMDCLIRFFRQYLLAFVYNNGGMSASSSDVESDIKLLMEEAVRQFSLEFIRYSLEKLVSAEDTVTLRDRFADLLKNRNLVVYNGNFAYFRTILELAQSSPPGGSASKSLIITNTDIIKHMLRRLEGQELKNKYSWELAHNCVVGKNYTLTSEAKHGIMPTPQGAVGVAFSGAKYKRRRLGEYPTVHELGTKDGNECMCHGQGLHLQKKDIHFDDLPTSAVEIYEKMVASTFGSFQERWMPSSCYDIKPWRDCEYKPSTVPNDLLAFQNKTSNGQCSMAKNKRAAARKKRKK